MKEGWFSESLDGNFAQSYRFREILLEKKTRFQEIKIVNTYAFGKMLILDGAVQTAVEDEYIYHEMIAHLPLLTHPQPERVLIIGGGDGGVLRRVLEHPVEKAILVELDEEVVKAAKEYLPEISGGAFEHPKSEVIIANGIEFLKKRKGEFDVILIDSTDPVGEAKALFSREFYISVFNALKPDGLAATQSGSPFFQKEVLQEAVNGLKSVFPLVRVAVFSVPTYPGVLWSMTLASKKYDPLQITPAEIEKRMRERNILEKTSYYNPEIHLASFSLPQFILEDLKDGD